MANMDQQIAKLNKDKKAMDEARKIKPAAVKAAMQKTLFDLADEICRTVVGKYRMIIQVLLLSFVENLLMKN